MDKAYIQRVAEEIDLSLVQDQDNLRKAAFTNKRLLSELQNKYPDVWKTCKELVYWSLHYKEPDFVSNQFCQCGKRKGFHMDLFRYRDFCSPRCARIYSEEKIKQTNLERYGTEYASQNKEILRKQMTTCKERYGASTPMEVTQFQEKVKQTNLEKYGYENVGQAHKDKIQQTLMNKYGVNSVSKLDFIQERIKQTNLKRYGSEQFLKSDYAKTKIDETNLKKYGVKNAAQMHVQHLEDQTYEFIVHKFVKNNRLDLEALENYFNIKDTAACRLLEKLKISFPFKEVRCKTQKEIFDFLYSHKISIQNNDRRVLSPKELDLYIPDKKIAIEYDGLMYHSFGKSNQSKFDTYLNETAESNLHLLKTQLCEQQGIHLFHIFENEWTDPVKREIWKSVLLNAIGKVNSRIYARKTEIQIVPSRDKIKFLDENHLQGNCSSSINLGLYYENELVSLMTFGKSRFNKKYEYELLRFCSKTNTSVVGGAGKLLKHFIKTYNPKSIISYANRRWSQGNLYEQIGFEQIGKTKPNYFYFHPEEAVLHNRIHFQKHKLKKLIETYSSKLTETENMYNNDYRKIYDCGNLVYSWNQSI